MERRGDDIMSKKTKSKEVKPSNTWKCCACGDAEFQHDEMMVHLKEHHGLDPKTVKGTRRMLMHLDGDTWFAYQWEWIIGDIKAIQHTVSPRSKDDMMRWA